MASAKFVHRAYHCTNADIECMYVLVHEHVHTGKLHDEGDRLINGHLVLMVSASIITLNTLYYCTFRKFCAPKYYSYFWVKQGHKN